MNPDPLIDPGPLIDPDWPAIELRQDLEVHATRPMPELAPAVEHEVAASWEQEQRTRPRLFNGTVFSADAIAPGRITGHWTEYRRVLAQMRRPDLFDTLAIRALAVNGLLECTGGILLGRREPGSVYQSGGWQSPPAGSVERRCGDPDGGRIDLAAQVLAECEEELGLQAHDVAVRWPMVAVEHPGSHIVDIGMLLHTSLDFTQVEAAWSGKGNREYDRLRLLAPDMPQVVGLLPTTRALIGARLRQAQGGTGTPSQAST